MKLLIKLPSREKPDRLLSTLEKIQNLISNKHEYQIVLSFDKDDKTTNNEAYFNKIKQFKNTSYIVRSHKNKVDAMNRDIDRFKFDILIPTADDFVPVEKDFDDIICNDMITYYPNLDGCVYYDLGASAERLISQPMFGVNLYKQLGYVSHPSYKCVYGDMELSRVLWKMNKAKYIPRKIIIHEWLGKGDELIRKNNKKYKKQDKENYLRRMALGFPQ